jgi:hypothetical protein
MSNLTGFVEVDIANRLKAAIQQRGAGENLIKNLAEIIKNSDDAYNELQNNGIDTTGVIEVGYWQNVKNKRRSINEFFIRDLGVGMTYAQAEKAFGKKSYGEDTSGNRRNGAIGVGGKDALYGMEDVHIITIKDKIPVLIELITKEGVLHTKISSDKNFVIQTMSIINNQIKKSCTPMKLDQNGTFIKFKLPKQRMGIKFETLKNHLRLYYTLRNITNGKNHTILKLIDVDTKDTFRLLNDEPECEILQKPEPFHIPYTTKEGIQKHLQVDVIIKRATIELDKDKELGNNFLIETNDGGILDNYMFGFQNDPGASKIFGNIVIHNWKSMFNDDQGLLPENREGLLWSHSFNKQIETRMKQFLIPILDQERRKLGTNPETDKQLERKMKSALAFLNKLMKEDDFEDEKDVKAPPEIMEFSYARMKVVPGISKSLKLFINPLAIPKFTEISTAITEEKKAGCSVEPIGIIKTPDKYEYPPEIPFIKFDVIGDVQGSDSHLKAYFQDYETEVTISVVSESELYPTNGFAFVPPSIRLVKGKTKRMRLVVDTHIFNPGTIISLESEDERVTIPYSKITVSEPNIGKYLSEEFFNITSETSRIQTKIIAKIKNSNQDERLAICKVKVIEKEESKVFFKDVKLDRAGDPRKRARFDEGIIWIHVLHPVLRHYFGNDLEKISKEPTKEAVALLADSVLNISLRQWAKKRINDGIVEILDMSKKDEEIDLEKDRLENKYGKQIHQTLTDKYHSEKIK